MGSALDGEERVREDLADLRERIDRVAARRAELSIQLGQLEKERQRIELHLRELALSKGPKGEIV